MRRLEAEKYKIDAMAKEAGDMNIAHQQIISSITTYNYRKCEEYVRENLLCKDIPIKQ